MFLCLLSSKAVLVGLIVEYIPRLDRGRKRGMKEGDRQSRGTYVREKTCCAAISRTGHPGLASVVYPLMAEAEPNVARPQKYYSEGCCEPVWPVFMVGGKTVP